jgi:putative ferrous iron transport protein C
MLIELRNYVVERGRVSMRDLVWRFEKEPDAIRQMLEHWIRKGRIEREVACPPCGTGCCACDSTLREFYVAKG